MNTEEHLEKVILEKSRLQAASRNYLALLGILTLEYGDTHSDGGTRLTISQEAYKNFKGLVFPQIDGDSVIIEVKDSDNQE